MADKVKKNLQLDRITTRRLTMMKALGKGNEGALVDKSVAAYFRKAGLRDLDNRGLANAIRSATVST